MTYSDNIEKLRQAGVIDMTKSFGCEILYTDRTHKYDKCYKGVVIQEGLGYLESLDGYDKPAIRPIDEIYNKIKILGHPLSYGRACRWIENNTEEDYIRLRLDTIGNKRHNKDLPLDDQENKEEIAEFLVSLIK